MKAFVTGGSGYIGSYLVESLLKLGADVIVYDLKFSENFLHRFGLHIQMIEGDLLSDSMQEIISKVNPTHVYHLAGVKNRSNIQSEFLLSNEVNFKGTLNLLNAFFNHEYVEHIVMMGTTEEYGLSDAPFSEDTREQPQSAYGLSKMATTRLAMLYYRQFGLPVTVVRPSIAFGPNQGDDMFLPALIRTLQRGEDFKMTFGEQYRDFVYIDDLVEGIIAAATNERSIGEIINIADGGSYLLKDVALYVAEKLSAKDRLKLGTVPYRKFEIMNYSVSIEKARSILKWEPQYSIFEAIDKVLAE